MERALESLFEGDYCAFFALAGMKSMRIAEE